MIAVAEDVRPVGAIGGVYLLPRLECGPIK